MAVGTSKPCGQGDHGPQPIFVKGSSGAKFVANLPQNVHFRFPVQNSKSLVTKKNTACLQAEEWAVTTLQAVSHEYRQFETPTKLKTSAHGVALSNKGLDVNANKRPIP